MHHCMDGLNFVVSLWPDAVRAQADSLRCVIWSLAVDGGTRVGDVRGMGRGAQI